MSQTRNHVVDSVNPNRPSSLLMLNQGKLVKLEFPNSERGGKPKQRKLEVGSDREQERASRRRRRRREGK